MKIKYIVSPDSRIAEFNDLISEKFPEFITEIEPEMILVMGGDGAMLHALQSNMHLDVPFFGIAAGTLNFLMNEVENKEDLLQGLINNSLHFQSLECRSINVSIISAQKGVCYKKQAVNEVVVGDNIMNYHHFLLNSEKNEFKDFVIKGSGLSISTPLGSTAFNFNNGGNVLPLGTNLWNITDIVCDYDLNDILVPQNFEISLLSDRVFSKVYVDGIDSGVELEKTDKVNLSQGNRIRIVFLDESNFVQKRIDLSNRYRKS